MKMLMKDDFEEYILLMIHIFLYQLNLHKDQIVFLIDNK
jgi:hypothetical protein